VFEGFGGWVEVDVECGAAVEVEVGYEVGAEGGLYCARELLASYRDLFFEVLFGD